MQDKYLALTPPMGWNSWNTFSWEINEELIKTAVDAMVSEGLKDAGYEYVVIDDSWSEKQRDKDGKLVPDHIKFPHGLVILRWISCCHDHPALRHLVPSKYLVL